jgi:hypothetical protein
VLVVSQVPVRGTARGLFDPVAPRPGTMPAAFTKPAFDEISFLTKASNCAELMIIAVTPRA